MYVIDELYAELINIFQQILGILRRSIELGRIEIMMDVSYLYQHLCSPSEVHLNAVYKILRYLKKNLSKNTGRVSFDTDCLPTDEMVSEI